MQTDRPTELSTAELLREITAKSALLVRKEIDLARAEARSDLAAELGMAKALGAAGALALAGVNLQLVAAVFALAPFAPGWLAALGLGGLLLVVAAITGVAGWNRRVRRPLQRTRRTLEEDVQWAKERLA